MGAPTDPIADFLTQIRNASCTGKQSVTIPASKLTLKIAEILKREGFIENFKVGEEGVKRFVRIHLKYSKGKQSAIQSLVRISKPGLRQYVNCQEVPRVLGGLGVAILSTSKGILTDREARTQKLGGELLCKVW
ncbi:MAG: 30S ribosomal protein S8 [Candidatus Omnitrophica bacterium]|nr:30S ribosomal protein S8 [Candidatus Omnitrophota bacterium]